MKFAAVSLIGSLLVAGADAHYIFGRLILDGQWSDTWEYIREVSPYVGGSGGLELFYPNVNPDSTDIRCGRNASVSWSSPKTATVRAGDAIGFGVGEPRLEGSETGRMYHPGFGSAWLSKSPVDDLNEYQGDGDWFKILSVTSRTEQSLDYSDPKWAPYNDRFKAPWGTFMLDSYNFTIPATTPPGKYLLRFEHIFPNQVDAQFYPNCAHIEVVNDGTVGTPGPVVQIPGAYTRGQPDVYFSVYDFNLNVPTFQHPAPAVWTG
jgi:hypothetical protein